MYFIKPFVDQELPIAVELTLYKHQIEMKLQKQTQKQVAIINSMGCGVVVTDTHGCIQIMNPVAATIVGWKQEEVLSKDFAEIFKLVDKDTGEIIDNLIQQVIKTGTVFNLPENCTLIARNGQKIPIGDNIAPIRDDDGNITGTVLVFQDISERKIIEAQLMRNAFYDGLTLLPNRVLFLDRLKQSFEHAKRRSTYRFAVLFVDLDGFKGINDCYGHGIGDDFLVMISRRLETCLRSGDTVARFGGDEFAVLLEDIQDVSDATNIAQRIHNSLKLPMDLDGNLIRTTASIGIVVSCDDYEEPRTLLRDADIAMYRAKEQGKSNYVVFHEQLLKG